MSEPRTLVVPSIKGSRKRKSAALKALKALTLTKLRPDVDVATLRAWLATWPDDGHWADATGKTVPVAKVTLTGLLDLITTLRVDHRYHESRELQLIELLFSHGIDAPAFEEPFSG